MHVCHRSLFQNSLSLSLINHDGQAATLLLLLHCLSLKNHDGQAATLLLLLHCLAHSRPNQQKKEMPPTLQNGSQPPPPFQSRSSISSVPIFFFFVSHSHPHLQPRIPPPKFTVTGTIFGQRRAHAHFCIQQDSHHPSESPLLLELSTPTCLLAKEMDSGLLCISLECDRSDGLLASCSLRSLPLWSMYCNGRKVGYATRQRASEKDRKVQKAVQAMSAGAGIIPPARGGEEEVIFMTGSYQRVVGSRDSEAFQLVDPSGSPVQELSVFLPRAG